MADRPAFVQRVEARIDLVEAAGAGPELVYGQTPALIELDEARNDGEREFWTNKCNVIERNIDNVVYDLYDLSKTERDLIENS